MLNCFIYCRVSTEEQADKGYSLDAQEKLCRDYAARNGYNVAEVYREEGETARNIDRPALKKLLSECGPNKSIDAVIVQETDRLARNTKDHLNIKSVLYKAGTKLISVAQPMLDDSPEGIMVDTIIASVNQFQSDINSRKTKRGMQEKFDLGWLPGKTPLGYIHAEISSADDYAKRRTIIKKDPERWHLMQEGLRLYLTGAYSADEINDILYEKGLRSRCGIKIPHSVIVSALKNPFYAGLMRWSGQERMGRHDPMITMNEHKHILEIMDSHNMHACRRHKHSFLLRGFVYCNICGHRLTAETHPKKDKSYYHCAAMRMHSNQGQNVEVDDLERQIEEQFKTIRFSQDFIDKTLKRLRSLYYEERESANTRLQVIYNRKKAVETKREKAEEKLLEGVLSDEAFIRMRTKFTNELSQLENEIDKINNQKECDVSVIQQVLSLARDSYREYKRAPYELKRQYLSIFWDKFLIEDKKIVEAVPTKLIQALQEEKQVIIMMSRLRD